MGSYEDLVSEVEFSSLVSDVKETNEDGTEKVSLL